MATAIAFLSGADTLGFLVAGLILLRAWRRTHDFLFLAFSAAFALLAVNQATMALGSLTNEEQAWVFLIRLFAFMFLIGAITAKNIGRATAPGGISPSDH